MLYLQFSMGPYIPSCGPCTTYLLGALKDVYMTYLGYLEPYMVSIPKSKVPSDFRIACHGVDRSGFRCTPACGASSTTPRNLRGTLDAAKRVHVTNVIEEGPRNR